MPNTNGAPPPLGFFGSLSIYAMGALLLYAATRLAIPLIVEKTGFEPIVAWFIAAGIGVFTPLAGLGASLVAMEPRHDEKSWLWRRLWLRSMTRGDWLQALAGAVAIAVSTAPLVAVLAHVYGIAGYTPRFLTFNPLTPDRMWILGAWAPFFLINMLGEAFIWHAVMLPRQVRSFGNWAWLVSGAGWALFHVALPWQILATLAPTILIIPFLVQRYKNVWIGIVLHVFVNGSGFLAVAFGAA